MFQTIQIRKSIYENNDREAALLRDELRASKTFLLNVMASPGAGKTTLLKHTLPRLADRYAIGVMEADIDSDVDAQTMAETGVRALQMNTGGMCHLDAGMTRKGLETIGADRLDLVVLENIGNLICPAGFDVGAAKQAVILSVPEGDDKPLKYPKMFQVADVLIISKLDAMSVFDFDLDAACERVRRLNPNVEIFPLSAKTGEGLDPWVEWLSREVSSWTGK